MEACPIASLTVSDIEGKMQEDEYVLVR